MNIELAWAAGFFDGEGYIGVVRGTGMGCSLALRIYISQKDREVLDRFKKAVGRFGISIYEPSGNNNCFKLQIQGINAYNTFNKIKPYLSRIKLEQGEKAIAEYEAYCLQQVA